MYNVGNQYRETELIALDLLNLTPATLYVDTINWSFDESSQILALYNNGTVNSFLITGAPPNYEKLRRIKREANPFVGNFLKFSDSFFCIGE